MKVIFYFFPGNLECVEETGPAASDVIEDEKLETCDWKKLIEEKDAEMEKLKKKLAEAEKQFRIQTQVIFQLTKKYKFNNVQIVMV